MALSVKSIRRAIATARRIRIETRYGYRATSTNDPAQLTLADVGKLYSVPMDVANILEFDNRLPLRFRKQVRTFDECVWLCRTQLLEVLNCLRNCISPQRPSLRVVLWGQFGTGKSLTLQQVVHYAHTQDFVIIADYEVMRWTRYLRENQNSSYTPGLIDTPFYAKNVLTFFKQLNQLKWKELSELKTERNYKWSKVESTPEGRPITEIVEMGLIAPFLATDCLGALCRELRRHATAGSIKLLVALDQANSLYGSKTIIRKPNENTQKVYAKPEELAQIQIFRRWFSNDWTNGACVLVADKTEVVSAYDRVTIPLNTPFELFGEEGLDAIDPFIPVETKRYVMDETDALYEYFIEKEWLTSEGAKTEQGRKQLAYLSAFVPAYYDRLCSLY